MWHYQIGKYKEDGKDYYGLFEMFDIDGKKGWTEKPVALEYSEHPQEIIEEVTYMLQDVAHYPIFDADDVSTT